MLANETPQDLPKVYTSDGRLPSAQAPIGIPARTRGTKSILPSAKVPLGAPTRTRGMGSNPQATQIGGRLPERQRCAKKTETPELNPLAYLCSHKEPSEAVAQAVCQQIFGKVDCD